MGFWNEYRDSVFDVPPLPTPGGGGGTPKPGTTPSAGTPVPGATPKVADRSTKEGFIIGLEDNQLQHFYLAGLISDAEMIALKGQAKLENIKAQPVTVADAAEAAKLRANPPSVITNEFSNYGASGPAGQMSAGNFNFAPPPGEINQPNVAGGFTPSSAPGASRSGTAGSSPSSGAGGSSGGGSRGSASPSAQAPATPPNPFSAESLLGAGAKPFQGGNTLLKDGQQYRNLNNPPVQNPADKLWYNTDAQGNPTGQGFKSQTTARLAQEYTNAGAGVTSRLGNSPTAKAAAQGGYSSVVNPEQSPFPLLGLDEIIGAGATKGIQTGDIATTLNRPGYQPMDVTYGGVPQGGGLTLVNPADTRLENGFTGVLPGNVSIGMSSLNNAGQGLEALRMTLGLPPSEMGRFANMSPQQLMLVDQAYQTMKQNGGAPNFAKLYAENEPRSPTAPQGYPDLKWGSANGGASNTPYDQALQSFLKYADPSTPDLTFLPDNQVLPGQSGGQQPDLWWLDDQYAMMGGGGQFQTRGPLAMVDMSTNDLVAVAGEAGDETVTVKPGAKAGGRPMTGGPKMMAKGGGIGIRSAADNPYDISNMRDENGQVTELGRSLGYSDQPFEGGGYAYLPLNGSSGSNVRLPAGSKSGQPVAPQFANMSVAEQNRFTTQGGRAGTNAAISGPIGPAPIGSDPRTGLPIYAQLNGKDYSDTLGEPIGYDYVPYNNAGTPILVQVPRYQTVQFQGPEQRKQNAIAHLTGLLNNNGVYSGGPGYRAEYGNLNSREATLAALYDIDPKTALLYASQGQGGRHQPPWGQEGGGWGGGRGGPSDRDIENEAMRKRQYDIQGRNYARAGLPSPTILDIPRQTWEGEGEPPWGSGEAPYERYGREVQNGFALPFDYEVGSPWYNRDNSGMGRGDRGGFGGWRGNRDGGGYGRPGGGYGRGNGDRPQWGQNPQRESWFNQLPWWARNARRYGPPVGSGMVGGA